MLRTPAFGRPPAADLNECHGSGGPHTPHAEVRRRRMSWSRTRVLQLWSLPLPVIVWWSMRILGILGGSGLGVLGASPSAPPSTDTAVRSVSCIKLSLWVVAPNSQKPHQDLSQTGICVPAVPATASLVMRVHQFLLTIVKLANVSQTAHVELVGRATPLEFHTFHTFT